MPKISYKLMQKTLPFYILTLLTFNFQFSIVNSLSAQTVTNVTAVQEGKAIKISYDLDKAADISIYFSNEGYRAESYRNYQKLTHVSGDVGKTITPGHKTIVWLPLEEFDDFKQDDVVFKVMVERNAERDYRRMIYKQKPFYTFFTINAAYSTHPQFSYGFKVGQVKTVGWFVSAMTNFNFKGAYQPFKNWQTYELNGNHKTVRFSAQAGLVVRPWNPMYLLFGVGYGYRAQTFQTTDKKWHSYPKNQLAGLDTSFGLMFNIKGFAVSGEVVSTNFKTLEYRIGLGYSFPNKKSSK